MLKFGQSTRDWLLGGPAELMPEEGPSKAQRLESRLAKVPAAIVALGSLSQLGRRSSLDNRVHVHCKHMALLQMERARPNEDQGDC
jgi:hypothetical protein